MLLNSDLAEGFGTWKKGNDEEIMRYIDMANLACGFHAGDPLVMTKAVKSAKQNGITIGAHPGYQDLIGFGRRSIPYAKEELKAAIIYQIGALRAVANSQDYDISYVKPHGALYNDMMKDEEIYKTMLEALSSYDRGLKLMILSSLKNPSYKTLADDFEIELIYEAFADRAYDDEGFLVSRKVEGSVISDVESILKRVKELQDSGTIRSINGKTLHLKVDSLCVHGDNQKALELTKRIREIL
ncbi:MAG: 5-oxoprolinase subunit PxpA [Epsilonproteobacteria bacterium]|nr:5-oxoprolinase subunit PxpA [Campylobacterota bacterium]